MGLNWADYDRKFGSFARTLARRFCSETLTQASCWSMKAVNWALLMAPTLVAAN